MPENLQLQDLQAELEKKCQLLEEDMYEDDDSENTSDVDSSEFSSTDESPEADRWRRKLQRRLVIWLVGYLAFRCSYHYDMEG